MSDFVKIQQDLNSKRQEINASSEKHMKAQSQLLKVEAREKELLRTVDIQNREELLKKVVAEKNKLNESIKRFSDDKKRLSKNLENLIGTFTQLQDPTEQIENLDDSYPFLLFPLRLETRFKKIDNATNQLWVRVYPDDCQINANEKIISESELTNAKLFWIEMWKAGGIEEQERGAWRSIVNSHGVGRAAWIIENYKPVDYPNGKLIKSKITDVILTVVSQRSFTSAENIAIQNYWKSVWDAGGDTLKENQALVDFKTKVGDALASEIIEKYIPVNFRDPIAASLTKDDVAIQVSILQLPSDEDIITKQTSWTQAPKATTMPDRFVAVCYTGENKRTVLFDKAVSDSLAVGPDPSLPENEQMKAVDGNMEINTELKWMVDFEEAIKVGMGMRINLTADETLNGFDKVFVIGLRLSSDQNETKVLLEDLILNHYHSKNGFELLKQGTPTNNTEDEASGYSWLDDADKGYDIVFKAAAEFTEEADFTKKTDGQKLAEYLGISSDTFKKIPNALVADQQESIAMNTALWPATLGYFMEEMMHPVFSDRDIEATRTFFTHFVSGRGPLPVIRIGKQPYGILPTTVFSKLQFYEKRGLITSHVEANSKTTFLNKLHELISKMDTTWDKLIPSVSHIGKQGDSHQILLDIIGLHANSVEFHQRYAQSIQQLFNQLNLQVGPFWAALLAAGINERGKVILRDLDYDFGDHKIPILEKFFLDKPTPLEGDMIDDLPLSEIKEIRKYSKDKKNYIEWLASSDFETIRKQDFGGEEAPTALLFLLLKHALMQAQADVARNLLITNNVVANKKAFHDPEFINVQQKGGGVSKYEFLFSKQPNITGNNDILLKDYIYKPATLQNVIEAKVLKETLDALKVLGKTPTARLERLLTEHLDCCNYRLDAWKTGLINYKLVEQRNLLSGDGFKKDGLYMGAYGWLEEVRPENKVLQSANLSVELKDIFNPQGIPEVQKDNTNLGYIHAPSLNQASTAAILRNAYITNADAGNANPFSINLSSDRVRLAQSFLEGIRNGQSLAALLGYQFERGLHDKYSLGKGEVDMFIYPLRKAFPLVANNLKDTKSDSEPEFQSIEAIDANNVMDGLKLINHIQKNNQKTYPFGLPTALNKAELPPANSNQQKAIEEEVDRIMNINDAIADLVVAEQVYQVVQGNFERAAGNAEAFSKGSYPPEIEVVNTPRTGVTLTQRVAIQFDTSADSRTSPNSIVDMTARAKAEPSINKWLSSVLPEPKDVLCNIKYSSPNVAEVSITISQEDLKLQSIDLLCLFNLDADQAMSELDDRIMNYVRYNLSNHSNTKLKIDYTSPIDIADKSKVSFFELAALIKSLRKILIQSKHLAPTDICLPNEASSSDLIFDTENFIQRIVKAKTDISAFELILQTLSISGSDIDTLAKETTEVFLIISLFGLPQSGIGFIHEGIATIYQTILDKIKKVVVRWDKIIIEYNNLITQFNTAGSDEEKFEFLQKAERTISSTSTFPLPVLLAYKNTIDGKKTAFDTALNELKTLQSSSKEKLTEFFTEVEAAIIKIKDHDIISFDVEDAKNDIEKEKQLANKLIKDIKLSTENLILEIQNRISESTEFITKAIESQTNSEKIAFLQQAAKKILGDEVLLLPHFTLSAKVGDELQNAHAVSETMLEYVKTKEDRIFPVEDWLYSVARVREKIFHWENIVVLAEGFKSSATIDLKPIQLPYKAAIEPDGSDKDRWLAMKFKDEKDLTDKYKIDSDKLLYTACFAANFDKTQFQCGILIDEWTEVIPEKEETTGIAFHCDQPNTEPPQVMLLVVPPVITGEWKWDNIVDSLEETLSMAKKRAIEPSQIETTGYAQFLPSTMMAVTLYWITVATNLAINNSIYEKID